jgi:hypothetical protein
LSVADEDFAISCVHVFLCCNVLKEAGFAAFTEPAAVLVTPDHKSSPAIRFAKPFLLCID